MANFEIRFQARLTRPGIELDKSTRGPGAGGKRDKKKITPGMKVRFEDALSNRRTFDCTTMTKNNGVLEE